MVAFGKLKLQVQQVHVEREEQVELLIPMLQELQEQQTEVVVAVELVLMDTLHS